MRNRFWVLLGIVAVLTMVMPSIAFAQSPCDPQRSVGEGNETHVSVGEGDNTHVAIGYVPFPDDVTYCVAMSGGNASINLMWTIPSGADMVVIRGSDVGYPASPTDGSLIYSGSGTSTSHSGLTPGEIWYYSFYGYDSTCDTYSDNSCQDSATVGAGAPTITNDSGAISITSTSALLRGDVIGTGGENPNVIVYWGLTDGGTNPASWSNSYNLGIQGAGLTGHTVDSLTPCRTYYYRYYASNSGGSDWANSSEVFATIGCPTPTPSPSPSPTPSPSPSPTPTPTVPPPTPTPTVSPSPTPSPVVTPTPSPSPSPTPGVCSGPLNLIATLLDEYTVSLEWTPAYAGSTTVIRMGIGKFPNSPTEGNPVYEGTGNSTTYYMATEYIDKEIDFRAWTQCP